MRRTNGTTLTATLCVCLILATAARAEVFHSRESALRLAFPDADRVEKRDLFLTDGQAERIEALARVRLPSRLVTVYVGWESGLVTGYAFIETHQVRTLPETIMIVVEPDGRVRDLHILAFHEPPEYAASPGWLRQFRGRALTDELSLRGDVAAITGATLTATTLTAAVRRTLAIHQVAIGTGTAGGGTPAAGTGH